MNAAPENKDADNELKHLGSFIALNREQTSFAAHQIAQLARRNDCIVLHGDLGAGKTSFVKAFASALGRKEKEVTSPTFTLVQTYDVTLLDKTPCALWHYDLYRLKEDNEVGELGIQDALTDGVVLIEWPEKADALLPSDRLTIRITFGAGEEQRVLDFYGSQHWNDRLQEFIKNHFTH